MTFFIALAVLAALLAAALEWGRYHPVPARAKPQEPRVIGERPPEWLSRMSTGELAELCLRLLSRMGYSMLAQTVEGDRAEVEATDQGPAHLHRVLLRAYARGSGPVTPARLRETLDHARAEGMTRAMVVGVAGFTREAEMLSHNLPLQLLDGAELADLSHRHLPELEHERAQKLPSEPPTFIDGRSPPHAPA
jgi:hypothetical protein